MKNLLKSATLVVATIIVFGMASCSSVKPIDKSKLSGYWVLKSIDGQDSKTEFEGPIPSIEFDFEKSAIAGSAGCNRYNGGFTLTDQNLFSAPNLASTMMACVHKNAEHQFLGNLGKPAHISIENGLLSFKDAEKAILQFEKGSAVEAGTGVQPLTVENLSGAWTLTTIAGGDVATLFSTDRPATVIFANDGKVNGNGGCNTYRGTYTVAGSQVTFGALASTRMACEHMEGEGKFTSLLDGSLTASINGNKLMFMKDGVMVLEFTKTADGE